MLVLALDTTTRAGSVAVVSGDASGDTILAEIVGDSTRTHGERLPRDLMRALDAAGMPLDAVDLLAVAIGPGSFTGLRVGIAAMQGLAMATDRRIVPISALDALAFAGADGRGPVACWIDAQRGEVFASLHDAQGDRRLDGPSSLTPAETLASWRAAGLAATTFIGDGAVRYRDLLTERMGPDVRIVPAPALAGVIGTIAARAADRAVLPHAVVPLYVRRSDAELARARGAGWAQRDNYSWTAPSW